MSDTYDRELIARMLEAFADWRARADKAEAEFDSGMSSREIVMLRDLSDELEAALAQAPISCHHSYHYGAGVEPYCVQCGAKEADEITEQAPAVRELVAKWRDAAEGSADSPNPTVKAVARCHIELATELEAALAQAPAVRVMVTEKPDLAFIANALLDFADDLESQGIGNGALRHQAKLLEAALGQGKGNGS